MARIVGVHGIGQQFKGANTLRASWLPALADGLDRVGRRLPSDNDFVCAFYGDLFRPLGKSNALPPLDASDVDDIWEKDLLELWWREARRVDPNLRATLSDSKVVVPDFVQRALNALSQSRFFAGLAERALIYDLKQVRRYFADSSIRNKARSRVVDAVGPDTSVIISHSLGSVVAYEALCAHPEWQVKTFVTLGSPLGIRNLIFHRLEPEPTRDVGVWPGSTLRWINIADAGDVVALIKSLSTCFGSGVLDRVIDNGARPHEASSYLTSLALGEALINDI